MHAATTTQLLFRAATFGLFLVTCHGSSCTHLQVSYQRLDECSGKTGINFNLSTLYNVASSDCAVTCEETFQCLLFFYSTNTRSCSLHNRTLSDIVTIPESNTHCFVAADVRESWIVEVTGAQSSHWDHPVAHVIGPPNALSWAAYFNHQPDFIEVTISFEMYIEQVHIYERGYPGGVSDISLLTPEGTWYPVWSTEQVQTLDGTRTMSPDLKVTHFKTFGIHIDIGGRSNREFIDAVNVVGKLSRLARSYVALR